MNCVFCKIIGKEFESSIVYEDNEMLAFMDIQPVNPGQVLVVPKKHIDHFSDIPEELAQSIFTVAHRLSRKVRETLSPERVGLVVHGYGVPHAHMIVVPQEDETDITTGKMAGIEDGKITFRMDRLPVAPREELNKMAERLKL